MKDRLWDVCVKTCNVLKDSPVLASTLSISSFTRCLSLYDGVTKVRRKLNMVSHSTVVTLLSAGWTNQRNHVLPSKQHQKSTERQGGVTRKYGKWAKWHVEKMSANYAYFTLTFNGSRWWASELSGGSTEDNQLSLWAVGIWGSNDGLAWLTHPFSALRLKWVEVS